MKNATRRNVLSLAVVTALGAASAALANHPPAAPRLGTPIHGAAADRTVVIEPGAKWVNVNRNETVKFVLGNQSFTWRFDTLTQSVIELEKIAPAGLLGGSAIKVYVGPDPMHDLG